MHLRRKNIFLSSVSFLILITGILFCIADFRHSIIAFLNDLFSLSLEEHFRSIGFYYSGTWMIISSSILFLYILRLNGYLESKRFYFFSYVIVIVHYFFHLSAIAENYPIYDDQGAILNFLVKFQGADSWKSKAALILMPYNESVLAVPKLFIVVWFKIFDEINFRQLVLFNGILLVLLQAVFFFRYFKNWSPWLLILTALFFQYQFYDDAFWAISGLCYYGAFLFTSGCIVFLLKKENGKNLLSAVFALLASFTFGNGWILFPMAVLFLLAEKKFNLLLPWILGIVITAAVFYALRDRFQPLTEVNWNPLENILFILIFLGSSLQFFYSPVIPVIGGLFVLSTFAYIIFNNKRIIVSFPFLILTFIILSAIAASPLRSGLEPYGQYGMRVRYGIFSITAIVFSISILFDAYELNKKKMLLLAGAAFIYNLFTGIFFYPEPVIRKENIEIVMQKMKNNIFEIRYTTYSKNEADNLFKEAISKGIYKP